MHTQDFPKMFAALTGVPPFPWQTALYDRFINGNYPESASLPTGLGKTSIIAIWLCALSAKPDITPRRLVYVVNRRTVVDQTTTEVLRLCEALTRQPELAEIRNALVKLCALPLPTADASPLAVSTLRGQFADNGEWCADPTRPAVVVGTVDMIGSGLLFSRYARGFKARPLHAGFLAQDALLVHDEAHLEPSFQKLLECIVAAQKAAGDPLPLRLLELTATRRSEGKMSFGLDENPDDKDTDNKTVQERYGAIKRLSLIPVTKNDGGKDKANDGTVRDKILELALARKDSHRAVLIFVRSVKTAEKLVGDLHKAKQSVVPLTGTMRGKERDNLVSTNPIFQRFLPDANRAANITPGTVYLVATSAGEVGVNISADDLICDLSTYESMAQRFGRVNRFGKRKETDASEIIVVYLTNLQANYDEGLAKAKDAKKDAEKKIAAYEKRNQSALRIIKTLALLQSPKLGGSASPSALDQLDVAERAAAFSPEPEQRVATEIQFDAWALTSIREPIAARPPVAPYLHGEAEWQPPETHVAWRRELDVVNTAELRTAYPPEDLLEDYPLKPHELLRDTSERIFDRLVSILSKRRQPNESIPDAWLVRENGDVEIFPLSQLISDQGAEDDDTEEETEEDDVANASDDKKAETARKNRAIALLADAILILPESLGGIDEKGLLTPDAAPESGRNADVADIVVESAPDKRRRVWSDTREVPAGFRLIRIIDKFLANEDTDDSSDNPARERYWLWLEAKNTAGSERRFTASTQAEILTAHTAAVVANTVAITQKLFPDSPPLPDGEPDLRRCLIFAAHLHDLGKNREQWQRNIGNTSYDPTKPETILAKSAPGMRGRSVAEHYRHELGSINDAVRDPKFAAELAALSDLERDIVLHVVAAHHGRARPHFATEEIFDYLTGASAPAATLAFAVETPRRFARLQERFGRWGLAWLESLLRAADYAASAGIVATGQAAVTAADPRTQASNAEPEAIVPTATLVVNPANPGHYFACCGLFELVATINPNAHAWFAEDGTNFYLTNTPPLSTLIEKISAAEIVALNTGDRAKSALEIRLSSASKILRLDWWRHEGGNLGKLKPWAGNTSVRDIADDMRQTLKNELAAAQGGPAREILRIVSIANNGEPFYFDANRAINARAQDVGFSADKLRKGGVHISTKTAPAVELLALVGLQRARPQLTIHERGKEREYDYYLWHRPLPIPALVAAVDGRLPDSGQHFRFSNPSRAKDYRAFAPANLIS